MNYSKELISMEFIESSIKERGLEWVIEHLKNPRVLGMARIRREGELAFFYPYTGIEVISELRELGCKIEKMYFSREGSDRKYTIEQMKEKYKSLIGADYPEYGYLHKLLEAIEHLEKFIVLARVYADEQNFIY